jgi:CHAD domain-containing protein
MEIEAKFTVTDDALAKQLRLVETLAGLTLTPGVTLRVHDTYRDTPDRRLLAAGFACRQRRSARAGALIVTLKQITQESTAIHAREEFEIETSKDAPPEQWQASPARDRVLAIIGDAPLQKLFDLYQTRVKREVMKDDSSIAEWSVDEVRVRAGNQRLKFAELEIELKPNGTPEDLTRLAAHAQAEWNLAPAPKSKFERALAWVDETKAATPKRRRRVPKIRLDDTMAEAARKTLLLHWGRMLDHEAGARAGSDIEQVHDMRVATRRMRAALRVFADYLDAAAFKPFAKMLRRTARTLGAVRDLDVFREKAQHYLDTLPDERQAELDPLLAAWQTEYQRAREELLALFDSAAYGRFKIAFEKFLRTPGAGAPTTDIQSEEPRTQRVRDELPIILLRGWATVRAYDESVSVPAVPLARLHQLRIASKGLRYTLEFFTGVLTPDAQPLIEQIKQLQDHLGNLQDAVVACNHLRDFLTWGEWSHAAAKSPRLPDALVVAPGVAAYLTARQTEIHELIQTFPHAWSPIHHSEFKNQLLALLAAW